MKKCKLIALLAFVTIPIAFIIYLYITTPKIETLKLEYDNNTEITIRVNQSLQVIKDLYPDPAFLRLRVISNDNKIVRVNEGKYSITGVNVGTTIIKFYDRNKLIAQLKVVVTS